MERQADRHALSIEHLPPIVHPVQVPHLSTAGHPQDVKADLVDAEWQLELSGDHFGGGVSTRPRLREPFAVGGRATDRTGGVTSGRLIDDELLNERLESQRDAELVVKPVNRTSGHAYLTNTLGSRSSVMAGR